jgi:hypothetical protein
MTPSRLLAFCFIAASVNCCAQSVYTRVISGFSAMAGGKTEWIDLDNDNDLDLLLAGSDGSATLTVVYENVGGTLNQRATNLPVMSAFASADYDNDGDTDLLAFNQGTPFTKLYRNNGGFVFSESTSLGTFSPSSAVWLDIDNDEDLDFLLVGNISVPRLFENTGTGFTEIVNTNFPTCSNCNSDVADINGDGKVDIIFTGGVTSLYLNTGNKAFIPDASTEFKQPTLGDVACGDFDGDGDLDILLTGLLSGTAYTAIYENKNNHLVERTDIGLTPVVTNSSSGLLWFNVNNDGKLDLLLSGSTDWTNVFAHTARAFKNNGGSFTDIHDGYIATDRYIGSYDAGDFDNDGDMDLGFQGTYAALEGVFSPKPVIKRMAGFYRHGQIQQTAVSNTKPLPPAVETFSEKAYRKEIRLKWSAGSDGETPAAGLFYNFYLKDATKKLIVPSVDFSNGNIHTANAPNGTGSSGFAFDMPEGSLYYAVQSVDGAKTGSVFSAERMFYHFNGPETVSAAFTDQQHVNLSWLDHSSLETNFEVLRSTSPATGFASLAILPPDTKSYADNFAFATETEYHYRIRGYNAQASVYDSLILVIPNRPTAIAAQSVNASKIKLTWSDQSQYETAYIIERKQGTGSFTTIATLGPNVKQYEDTQLLDGTAYEYRVISQGKNGTLAPTTSVTAITNAKPDGLNFEVQQDEDKTLVLTSNDFNSHFTDADASDNLVRFKIVSLPDNGTLYVYTSKAVVGQEVTPDLFNFIEFKPFPDYAGTTTFKVLSYDGKDYAENDWLISLKINQINDPPTFDLLSAKVLDEDFAGNVKILAQPHYFSGEESQVITYSLSPQTSDIVDVLFNETNGEISLASHKDKFGEVEFTVATNDGQAQNSTYSRKVKVAIKPVNDPPVLEPITNVQAESSPITIYLDVKDPDNNITLSMFSAFSSNNTIVKSEKIKFSTSEDEKIKMTIVPEAKTGETNITVRINDGGFYVSQQFKFSMVLITGLDEDPGSNINVFPNPVSKDLQIQRGSGNEILTFILTDVHGRRLQLGIIDTSTVKIDLSEFASGLYFLEIADRHRTIISKKIIKR